MARHDKDFYITPQSAIDVLLQNYELRPGWILEPCAGNGAICKALRERSTWDGSLDAVEIREEERAVLKEYCDEVHIGDFLEYEPEGAAPGTIITNPPFSLAQKILEHCFEIADEKTEIIMLLRLGWLEAKKRVNFWKKHRNVSLITLAERPSFTGEGTDFSGYGWFIWNTRRQFILPCVNREVYGG